MFKKNRIFLIAVLAFAVATAAAAGSYALAQSGGQPQTATTKTKNVVARHIDYNVSLQVNGDLSSLNPKLKGILPLSLGVKGGADVKKDTGGLLAQGSIRLSGLDSIIQKIVAAHGSGNGAALGSLASGALSDIQFAEVNNDLYLKLGGTWYEATGLQGCRGPRPAGSGATVKRPNIPRNHPDLKGAFPGGAKALLKNVKQTGQENIDGAATTHYTATLDLGKAITEEAAALNKSGKTAQASRLEAASGQITGAFKRLNLEWWIDADGHIRQVKLDVEVEPAALAALAGGKNVKTETLLKDITSVKLDATVKFSNFGEDFQVVRPAGNVKPLGDLLGLPGIRKPGNSSNPGNGPNAAWHAPEHFFRRGRA